MLLSSLSMPSIGIQKRYYWMRNMMHHLEQDICNAHAMLWMVMVMVDVIRCDGWLEDFTPQP